MLIPRSVTQAPLIKTITKILNNFCSFQNVKAINIMKIIYISRYVLYDILRFSCYLRTCDLYFSAIVKRVYASYGSRTKHSRTIHSREPLWEAVSSKNPAIMLAHSGKYNKFIT